MVRTFWSDLIGHLGLGVNPQTGRRVRTKAYRRDDWGNTSLRLEEKDVATGEWKPTRNVEGSSSGGHYG